MRKVRNEYCVQVSTADEEDVYAMLIAPTFTQRKRVRKRRRSETRYPSCLTTRHTGIYTVRQTPVSRVKPRAASMLGYSSKEEL